MGADTLDSGLRQCALGPGKLYKTVFEELVKVCQAEAPDKQRKFRFRHPLLSLDSTMIPVCASLFDDWAKYVKAKGAVKVHAVLDNRGRGCNANCVNGGALGSQPVDNLRF